MSEVPPPPSSVPAAAPPPPPPPPPTLQPQSQSPGGWAPAASTPSEVELRAGAPLATPGRRLGGYLLDVLLFIVTLGIGWIVWSFVIWGEGVSPAKRILKMRVVRMDTGQTATWGTMALREIVGKWIIFFILGFVPFLPFVLYFMLLWDKNRQELWDKVATTVVVDDRDVVKV